MQSLWMLLASFLFAIVGITIKFAATAGYSIGEVVFYRTFIGLVVVSLMMAMRGVSPKSKHTVAHLYRGAAGTFAMWLFVYAVVHLPLSTAITLNFTAPLWIGLLLALVFGEHLSRTMIAALAMGFLGIVILLKPIVTPEMRFDITIALLSGVGAAVALLNVRRLGALHEPEMRIFWWSSLIVTAGAAAYLTVTGGWHMHGSEGLKWILAMGAVATAGQLAQTRAYSRGATMLAANLSYSTVLFSAIAGLLIWDEHIPASGWLAIAIIIASGIMATLRARKSAHETIATVKPTAAESAMTYTTIISTSDLAAHLNDPDWIILDCQHDLMKPAAGHDAYAREHIPGALFVAMDEDLAAPKTGSNGRHPLPSPDALTKLFSRLGITAGKQVVVYDSAQNMYAGRLWWTLKWLGHDAVALLDGSLTKWKAEGRALTDAVASRKPATFTAHPRNDMKVDAAFVAAHLNDRKIIDARAPDRYDGSAETVDPVGGHIPGALNRFWKSNINADGSFKSAATLRAEFDTLLAGRKPEEVIQQCGSGVTACHNLVAMEIARLPGSKLYPGSWSEWSSDASRPTAKGSQP